MHVDMAMDPLLEQAGGQLRLLLLVLLACVKPHRCDLTPELQCAALVTFGRGVSDPRAHSIC
jgi:hypothetical protein